MPTDAPNPNPKKNPSKMSPPAPKKKRKSANTSAPSNPPEESDLAKNSVANMPTVMETDPNLVPSFALNQSGMITSPHNMTISHPSPANQPHAGFAGMPNQFNQKQPQGPQNPIGAMHGQPPVYLPQQLQNPHPVNYQNILHAMNSLGPDAAAFANQGVPPNRFPPQKGMMSQQQPIDPAQMQQQYMQQGFLPQQSPSMQQQSNNANLEQAIKMMNVMAASAEFNMLSQQQQHQILSSVATLQKSDKNMVRPFIFTRYCIYF